MWKAFVVYSTALCVCFCTMTRKNHAGRSQVAEGAPEEGAENEEEREKEKGEQKGGHGPEELEQDEAEEEIRPKPPPYPPPSGSIPAERERGGETATGEGVGTGAAIRQKPEIPVCSGSFSKVARPEEMTTIGSQDILDSLLVAARDSAVSGSAGLALGKLALCNGAVPLVGRAAELLADHSKSVTERAVREGLPHRVSLYKIVTSVLKENGVAAGAGEQGLTPELARKFAALAVADLTAINIGACLLELVTCMCVKGSFLF